MQIFFLLMHQVFLSINNEISVIMSVIVIYYFIFRGLFKYGEHYLDGSTVFSLGLMLQSRIMERYVQNQKCCYSITTLVASSLASKENSLKPPQDIVEGTLKNKTISDHEFSRNLYIQTKRTLLLYFNSLVAVPLASRGLFSKCSGIFDNKTMVDNLIFIPNND